jgi:NADH:ubiquinone reductase (H+-translocating)
MARQRVVIVGAGFGGIECAKKLNAAPVDVLLLDRHNYFVFTPLLYQVASSLLNPSDIAFPVRRIFANSPNVRFRQEDVTGIDFVGKRVHTRDGGEIGYDHLVLAAGSTTNYFGNQPIERSALGLKTLSEALQLRNHILGCLEAASKETELEAQRPWLTYVIVGGGPTGVEYAGALAELMRLVLRGEYPLIRAEPRIVLVEGHERVLGMFSEKLSAYTKKRLEALGVEVVTGTLLQGVDGDTVTLAGDQKVTTKTLVWSAGVKPETIAFAEGVPRADRSKRVAVDDHLRVAGVRRAFAIGDIAAVKDGPPGADRVELPMVSAPAMQAGRYVADFILSHLDDPTTKEPRMPPFRYEDKGSMATIGRNAAVCAVKGIELTGFVGWLGWLVVHIYYLIGFRNRLIVLWSWAWNYLWYDRPVRIITRAKAEPSQLLPRSET